MIISKSKKILIFSKFQKCKNLIKQKIVTSKQVINIEKFSKIISNLNGKNFAIDGKSCSIFYENIIKSKFKIKYRDDPTYFLKAIKNNVEINHMIRAHILDGIALTKFIFWIQNINKKKINEVDAQNKLEKFRRMNKNFIYPSFDTIAGSGKNGAIIHYRAKKENCNDIKKNDLFLCDSGGQYKFGTTDVTRTICFSKPSQRIKDIFTYVLKGHIAVATSDLNKHDTGKKIDTRARRYLKKKKFRLCSWNWTWCWFF